MLRRHPNIIGLVSYLLEEAKHQGEAIVKQIIQQVDDLSGEATFRFSGLRGFDLLRPGFCSRGRVLPAQRLETRSINGAFELRLCDNEGLFC